MQYDRLGFPIPKEFETSAVRPRATRGERAGFGFDVDGEEPAGPPRWPRYFLLFVLLFGVVPVLLVPHVLPWVRQVIVDGAVRQAIIAEGRADVGAAARQVGRAVSWVKDAPDVQQQLLCWRSTLRLQNRDTRGAIADATAAALLVPTSSAPLRARAVAHVVAGDADAALADAEAAVAMDGDKSPEALNHRAYIRALVGRELPAALADIEKAMSGGGAETPEFLDTRGFILHLLGRHHEAIDDLNRAIVGTQQTRTKVLAEVGGEGVDPAVVRWRLRPVEHALAVIHQHRALACRAVGLAAQAAQDFETAERKGFAPDRGVL
jgi:tetratricopeptide (TPR) repeat protein